MVWSILKLFAWSFHEPIVFYMQLQIIIFSKFPHKYFGNDYIEHSRHDTLLAILLIRVSGASHLQHAYEIKDFGSTRFRCRRHRNHVEQRSCDTFRVSDTLCLQHAYEIKDFGSTIPSSKNL